MPWREITIERAVARSCEFVGMKTGDYSGYCVKCSAYDSEKARALKLAITILAMSTAAFGQVRPSPVVTKAQTDFDKVDAAPIPSLSDTMACVQSSAAASAAVRPEERYLYQYRKGYCELFGATVNGAAE